MGPLALIFSSVIAAHAQTAPAAPAPAASEPPANAEVVFVAVGDMRLDGPVGAVAKAYGSAAPTAAVKHLLQGDILFGNLETSITSRGAKADKKWTFRSPSANLRTLHAAGFDVVNLANNHVMDYGPVGLADTLASLVKRKLAHFGAGPDLAAARKPIYMTRNGVRIGLIGLTSTIPEANWAGRKRAGVAYSDFKRFPDWIRAAKKDCDVLIVSFHGGTELAEEPNEIQRAFGREAVDAGADLVLSHHPHVVQAAEVYKGKVILHSLGNFLFVSPNPATRWSIIARARLGKEGVSYVELVPVDTNYGRIQPAPPEGAEAVRAALDRDGALAANPNLLRFSR